MKNKWIALACFAALAAVPAFAQETTDQPPYDIRSGDTLWDLSGRFYNTPPTWPKLWSKNPQIHNPHWIYPGDMLFLRVGDRPMPEPEVHEIRLVVEKLEPPPPPKPVEAVKPAQAQKGEGVGEGDDLVGERGPRPILLGERYVQGFISPDKMKRLGQVNSVQVIKIMSASPEEVELALEPHANLKKGDLITLIDDSRKIFHPVTNKFVGYHVKVLAQAEVRDVEKNRAHAKLLRVYNPVQDGNGVVPYRKPILSVTPKKATTAVNGVVLAGSQETEMFVSDNMVFVDKGKADGLAPGMMMEVPYPVGPEVADGMTTRLDLPIARGVVASCEEKTSVVYLLESRKAVKVGHRATASADSP